MTEDARFEDADEAPLRLAAFDTDDLQVVSALVQAAIPTPCCRCSRWVSSRAKRLPAT